MKTCDLYQGACYTNGVEMRRIDCLPRPGQVRYTVLSNFRDQKRVGKQYDVKIRSMAQWARDRVKEEEPDPEPEPKVKVDPLVGTMGKVYDAIRASHPLYAQVRHLAPEEILDALREYIEVRVKSKVGVHIGHIYRMKNGEVIEVRSDTRRSRPGKPAMVEYLVIESPHRPHFAGNMTSMKLNGFYKAVEAEVTAAWKAKKAREAQRPDDKPPTPGTLIGIFIDETLDTVQDAYTRFTEKPS